MRAQHELGYLINPDDNYRLYRERDIHRRPALPFLFPIIRAAQRRGGMAFAMEVVNYAKLYTVENPSRLENLKEGISDKERRASSMASSSTAATPRSWYFRFLSRLLSCLGR